MKTGPLKSESDLRKRFANYLEFGYGRNHPALQPFAKGITLHGVELGDGGGNPDLLLVGPRTHLGLVEVKLGRNPEFGRRVVWQLLGYYVHAISRDWADFRDRIDQAFWRGRETTLAQEIARRFQKSPFLFLPRLRERHDSRKYRLYALVDDDGWRSRKGAELREAGDWAREFLLQTRVMRRALRAWFVVWKPPKHNNKFEVIDF